MIEIYAEIDRLKAEVERLRKALERIRDWPYDITGDCVYDARKEAQDALVWKREIVFDKRLLF